MIFPIQPALYRKLLTGDLPQIIKAIQKISKKIKAEMIEM
ncbi:hypothetical protein F3D3_1054 [Fusibacter sp. 3D3]|nr:hypothetical protein F3D3_1054 [Fusibacter sp. 3D3]